MSIENSAELRAAVERLDKLPEPVKADILALVESAYQAKSER